jgi:hypothetical protein
MPVAMSPTELGVVAIVLLLAMKEVIKFAKDLISPMLSKDKDAKERIQRDTVNDSILKQLAASMEKQVTILQRIEFLISTQAESFREFVHHFHEHEKDMLEHKN